MRSGDLSRERGSIPLAMLAMIVVGGLVTVVVAGVVTGQQQGRYDVTYEQSLQEAEIGLEQAVHLVQSRAATDTFCIDGGSLSTGTCPAGPPASGFRTEALRNASGQWAIVSSATVGETTRTIRTEVEPDSMFLLAAFGKFFTDFNGGNGADSYSAGTWDHSTDPPTFTPNTSWPLICRGSPTGSPITDPTDSSQSDAYVCQPRKGDQGIVATNGALNLKGQAASDTDRIEIHNAMAPHVADPLPTASGYCDGVPAACSKPPEYFRDPIEVPDPNAADHCSDFTSSFPNASTPTDANGNWVLTAGTHCYVNVDIGSDTVIEGTPVDPSVVYMTGTLTVPKQEVVNFERDAGGNILPRPRPAASLVIQSTGTGPSLKFGAHASIAAAVYAPNAGFSGGAQGNIYGSLIAGSINNNGGWNFHYDESLAQMPTASPLEAMNWSEQ